MHLTSNNTCSRSNEHKCASRRCSKMLLGESIVSFFASLVSYLERKLCASHYQWRCDTSLRKITAFDDHPERIVQAALIIIHAVLLRKKKDPFSLNVKVRSAYFAESEERVYLVRSLLWVVVR